MGDQRRSLSLMEPMLDAVLVLLDLRFRANLAISSRVGSFSIGDQLLDSLTRSSGLT